MAYKRLTEEHPLQKKIRELEHLMDEMNITISVGVDNQLFVTDWESGEVYAYLDSEFSFHSHESTTEFPLGFETKLVRIAEE